MKLHTLLQFSFVLVLPILTLSEKACRCLYGQSCWPNENDFVTLTAQLSRPIMYPLPPASACYPSSTPSGNCSDVLIHNTDENWRAEQPGSMQNINFEKFIFDDGTISACYLNASLGVPCGQGSVTPVAVDARSVGDVQAAVNFAKQHNLKLVVKNTGHDCLGRSTARGGFMLWTHNVKGMSYDSTFVPDGAPATTDNTFNAATLGAGIQWREAYEFVHKQGRSLVGSVSPGGSVGAAGGWVMGGGQSALSPKFGLGVDNVLQFSIVLANGSLVTTNSFQHPDLFWALRGGGGGTYGVVTSITYQAHPIIPIIGAFITANFTSPAIAQNVVTEFIKFHPKISDAEWSGYSSLCNSSLKAIFFAPNVSWTDFNTTLHPFVEYVSEATGGLVQNATASYSSFYELNWEFFAKTDGGVGYQAEVASRLLPRSLAESDPAKAAKIMLSIHTNGLEGVSMASVAGGAVSRVDPDSTGLNPSWRKALSEVYIAVGWQEGATTDFMSQLIGQLKQATLVLDQLTTDSGSYINDGSLHELDFKKSFFGTHYNKLKSIKDQYDLDSLFVIPVGVGSDEWDAELVCRV